jgi:hypothetical protein
MSGLRLSNGNYLYRCARASETRCYHGISAHLLDQAIWTRLERVLADPERIADELERAASEDPSEPDLAAIDREAGAIGPQLENLTRGLGLAGGDADVAAAIVGQMRLLSERKRTLAEERSRVLGRHAAAVAARERILALGAWCRRVGRRLEEFGYAERRLAVVAFGVEVTVWRADHEPRWEMRAGVPDGEEIVYPTPARSVHNTNLTLRWSADSALARVG